jgi:DNA-binding LytR/AlgR family response regulator
LLKPIAFERFLIALKKATTAILSKTAIVTEDEATVLIKSGTQTYRVKVADILYLEKDRNYLTVHLKDKQILIRENMTDIFDLVPASGFVRVHKSYVVAIRHITMIEMYEVTVNGAKIPVGSTYREALRVRLGMG